MNEERKTEEFEDDRKKWKIYFDIEPDRNDKEKLEVIGKIKREILDEYDKELEK